MKEIILLHGAIGAADQLEPLKKELMASGYTVHAFNFSGHGQTLFSEKFGIGQFAAELENFIAKNNLTQPDVFGYSMGGYVALYLASQKQDALGKIITLGTKFEWSPDIAQREIKMLDANTIKEKVPKFADALQKRHGNDWELLLKRTTEMMIGLGKNNLLNETAFSKIQNAVIVGLADADNMVSVAETDLTSSKINSAKRYTLQNTKHPIETVDVKALAGIIRGFCT